MMGFRTAAVVFRFEWGRTRTLARAAFCLALILFPTAIVGMIRYEAGTPRHPEGTAMASLIQFFLIPAVICQMALLLWATPVIHLELEGRTWSYLAVRPGGKGSILLGKYMTAVAWTILCAWLSLTLSLAVVQLEQGTLRLWATLAVLIVLSSMAYGALYVLLGVLFLRLALVVAVAYTFLMEFVVSFIPAMIHQLTIQYHLRCLLAKWVALTDLPRQTDLGEQLLFSTAPAWQHVLVLLGFTAGLLTLAVVVLRRRELVKPDEA